MREDRTTGQPDPIESDLFFPKEIFTNILYPFLTKYGVQSETMPSETDTPSSSDTPIKKPIYDLTSALNLSYTSKTMRSHFHTANKNHELAFAHYFDNFTHDVIESSLHRFWYVRRPNINWIHQFIKYQDEEHNLISPIQIQLRRLVLDKNLEGIKEIITKHALNFEIWLNQSGRRCQLIDEVADTHDPTLMSYVYNAILPFFESNYKDKKDRTLLFYAVGLKRSLKIIGTLITRNPSSIREPDKSKIIPLMVAAYHGYVDIAKDLLEKEARVSQEISGIDSALRFAAQCNHPDMIKTLIEYGAVVNVRAEYSYDTPLMRAAKRGHVESVVVLLNHQADLSLKNLTQKNAVELAIMFGHAEVVQAILNHLKQVTPLDERPLRGYETLIHVACNSGHINIVKLLLAAGADPNGRDDDGKSPIHYAITQGHDLVVRLLLQHSANARFAVTESNLETTLHHAAKAGSPNMIKTLLAHGVNPDLCTIQGETALMKAIQAGNVASATILLAHTQNINARRVCWNDSALHLATQKGDSVLVSLLLEKKNIYVDMQAQCMMTPLHEAATRGDAVIAELLIEKGGANATLPFSNGDTSADLARKNKHMDLAAYLEKVQEQQATKFVREIPEKILRPRVFPQIPNLKDAYALASVNRAAYGFFKTAQAAQQEKFKRHFNHQLDALGNKKCNWLYEFERASKEDYAGFTPLQAHLFYLAKDGNVEEIKKLMADPANKLDFKMWFLCDKSNHDLGMWVAQSGCKALRDLCYSSVLEYFKDEEGRVVTNKVDPLGKSLLFYTVLLQQPHDKLVALAELNREAINQTSTAGHSPLYFAAKCGNVEAADFLIKRGARINHESGDDGTPLYAAVFERQDEMIKLLVERGADVSASNKNGWSPLLRAVNNNDINTVRYLLTHVAYIHWSLKDFSTALHIAAKNGNLDIAALLLDFGMNIDALSKNGTALCVAILHNQHDMIKLLVDRGASVNVGVRYNSPLYCAVKNKKLRAATYLLNHDADPNEPLQFDGSLLHVAALNKDLEMMALLIRSGANINHDKGKGWTPLLCAVDNNSFDVAKSLLEQGACVAQKSGDSQGTALHHAVHKERADMVALLLRYHADVDAADIAGITPLRDAVAAGDLYIIDLLLKAGADPNKLSTRNESPFSIAIMYGRLKVVMAFVNSGLVSLTAALGEHETAIELAERYSESSDNHALILKFLTETQQALEILPLLPRL